MKSKTFELRRLTGCAVFYPLQTRWHLRKLCAGYWPACPRPLKAAFAAWVRDLSAYVRGVISIDGKSVRASKWDGDGTGALHLVSAYAHEAGLVFAQQGVDKKRNEITAIPELLDILDLHGCIVTIDAVGTQKEIAARIIDGKGDYVLALKGNQSTPHTDVGLFFVDPVLVVDCLCHDETSVGHGRIKQRRVRVADASWLANRHPERTGLKSIASITTRRTIQKSGITSNETRLYITSLPTDPVQVAAAVPAHWSIENNVHWALDLTFREDERRTRKDHSARNLAMFRCACSTCCGETPPDSHSSVNGSKPASILTFVRPQSLVNDL